ncbi:hypothetical protein SLA2020_504770 [Shorea laevis]
MYVSLRRSGRNLRNGCDEEVVERVTEGIISEIVPETDLKQPQDKDSVVRTEDDGQEQSFWQGFESESGELKGWMGRRERKPNKQRRKKTRSCSVVYKKSRREVQPLTKTKRRKLKKSHQLEEMDPSFYPGGHNEITDFSIDDSGINNRNRCLRVETDGRNIEQIWDFAMKIGVVDRGNKEEILEKLKTMEDRDKENHRRAAAIVAESGGNRCADF